MENKAITIYHAGAFGVSKIEGKLIDYGTKKHAQYDRAPFIHFIAKGKRKPTGFVQGYHPYLVVIEGHGHINTIDPFNEAIEHKETGLITKESTYSCFDEKYKTDFDASLTKYLEGKTILMDIRHTTNTNVLNK